MKSLWLSFALVCCVGCYPTDTGWKWLTLNDIGDVVDVVEEKPRADLSPLDDDEIGSAAAFVAMADAESQLEDSPDDSYIPDDELKPVSPDLSGTRDAAPVLVVADEALPRQPLFTLPIPVVEKPVNPFPFVPVQQLPPEQAIIIPVELEQPQHTYADPVPARSLPVLEIERREGLPLDAGPIIVHVITRNKPPCDPCKLLHKHYDDGAFPGVKMEFIVNDAWFAVPFLYWYAVDGSKREQKGYDGNHHLLLDLIERTQRWDAASLAGPYTLAGTHEMAPRGVDTKIDAYVTVGNFFDMLQHQPIKLNKSYSITVPKEIFADGTYDEQKASIKFVQEPFPVLHLTLLGIIPKSEELIALDVTRTTFTLHFRKIKKPMTFPLSKLNAASVVPPPLDLSWKQKPVDPIRQENLSWDGKHRYPGDYSWPGNLSDHLHSTHGMDTKGMTFQQMRDAHNQAHSKRKGKHR